MNPGFYYQIKLIFKNNSYRQTAFKVQRIQGIIFP